MLTVYSRRECLDSSGGGNIPKQDQAFHCGTENRFLCTSILRDCTMKVATRKCTSSLTQVKLSTSGETRLKAKKNL